MKTAATHKVLDWRAVAAVAAVLGLLLPWIWQAAKYPDRQEFDAARIEMKETEAKVTEDIRKLREEYIEVRTDLKHIKDSQSKIERLLERLLSSRDSR